MGLRRGSDARSAAKHRSGAIAPNRISLRIGVPTLVLAAAWAVFAFAVAPGVVESAYRAESLPAINQIISGRDEYPLDHYFAKWRAVTWAGLGLLLAAGAALVVANRPEVRRILTRRRVLVAGTVAALVMIVSWLVRGPFSGNVAIGWEYLWIAECIAEGRGFEIDARHRWTFIDFETPPPDPDKSYPTALEEPIYPVWIALWLAVLGDGGRAVVGGGQLLMLGATAFLVYRLGRLVFDWRAGLVAAALLLISSVAHRNAEWAISPSVLGGLLAVLAAQLMIGCMEMPSLRRGLALGALLGAGCLTLASLMFFIPVAVLVVLLGSLARKPSGRLRWQSAGMIALGAVVVVAPWTIRNYVVFDTFVPIRTGAGLIAHQGNPTLAGTFAPSSHNCADEFGTMWSAADAGEAIMIGRRSLGASRAIYKRSHECIELRAPSGWEDYNEAQRDAFYGAQARAFIFDEPGIFLHLAYHKLTFFLYRDQKRETLVLGVLAALGTLVGFRNRRALVLVGLVLVFASSYVIGVPWSYRYRYPIDPLLMVLAGFAIVVLAKTANALVLRLVGATPAPPLPGPPE